MTSLRSLRLLLVLALAGCAAGATSAASGNGGKADAGSNSRDASVAGHGGSSGSGGGGGINIGFDAPVKPPGDAGRGEPLPSNLSPDGPVACMGCGKDAAADASPDAAATADGGRAGAGGSASGGSSGGAAGSFGSSGGATASAGGATGRGGSIGSGGMSSVGGSVGFGGSTSAGAGGSSGTADASVFPDGGPSDAGVIPPGDAGVRDTFSPPDTSPSDGGADALPGPCVARIRGIVPVADTIDGFSPLFAGANVQVVLRAEVLSGTADSTWTWQGSRAGIPLSNVSLGQADLAAAAFPITSAGDYTFLARDKSGACAAVAHVNARDPTECQACDQAVLLHIAPLPSSDLPVQDGFRTLVGSTPFTSATIIPSVGIGARIAPSVSGRLIDAYVRINQSASPSNGGSKLVTDGLASAASGFPVNLVSADRNGSIQLYDVLVVPLDGAQSPTIAASAPQLFRGLTAGDVSRNSFALSGGASVTGTVRNTAGSPAADVRVILTNQNPSLPGPSSNLIFSSVGSSNAQGAFSLHAQPGTYWVSISPSPGSGLPEALAPSPITLIGDTSFSFQWDAPSTGAVELAVLDAAGLPSVGTRVRLTSAGSSRVGTMTLGSSTQLAQGNVQAQAITSTTGVVRFAGVPDGTNYEVLLAPPATSLYAATTVLSLKVPVGGTTQTVRLQSQGMIKGQLVGTSTSSSGDWSQTFLVAYDRSDDSPEAPLNIQVNRDGSFLLPVSPGRPYVVLALPPDGSGYAPTFVGPGLLQANEFSIKQKVLSSVAWASTAYQNGYDLSGTALQVLCGTGYAGCVDPTIPLAETTVGSDGSFALTLPDWSTR